ncbi:MAG: TonB family protein [Desulfobacterales bacterium]|nr:TonB family protein [Desulfobacterales bacterium]
MKSQTNIRLSIIGILVLLTAISAGAQVAPDVEKTLSPYFFVKSDDPDIDQLPLKATSVNVKLAGIIADVVVTQVYKNEGRKPLEALYVFPASTRSAVYGMKMTIGERTIIAKIDKREEARQQYEQAKQEGKSASLLEQQRPNVFQMNVANILPSDVIQVELKYTELLVPTDAVYEFVFPTVVGPRYVGRSSDESGSVEQWTANPYLHQGQLPPYTFDIVVNLTAGLPIQDITCPSHAVKILYTEPTSAAITLDDAEKTGGNRDFILKYRLAGGKIQTGLLLSEGQEENFFLLMMQPPKQVNELQIPPREYIFIVDVSGSMHGFPLDISKKLLKDLISNLRPTDQFNVLLFAGGSSIMSPESLPATSENIRKAIDLIEQQRGGGGTELLPALKKALSLPKSKGVSRSLILATDGYVSVETQAFDLIQNNLDNANMFAFGIGSSVNRYLIEGMARVGMGEPFIITRPEEAVQKAENFRKLIQSPVLTGIKLDFNGFDVYDVQPLRIPDVMAERPVIVFGKWRGKPKGYIRLSGTTGNYPYEKELNVTQFKPLETNSALCYLWARHRISLLSDYNRLNPSDNRVQEVTHLGLTYNLLTAYTSFVAIDNQVRLENGQALTIKQPLPLPQGVSDYAVGIRGAMAQTGSIALDPATLRKHKCEAAKEGLISEEKDRSAEPAPEVVNLEQFHIKLKEIVVTSGLEKDQVEKLIEKQMELLNRCYNEAFVQQTGLKGEIVFVIKIDPQGRVSSVKVQKYPQKNKTFDACMLNTLKNLQFPAPQGGQSATLTLTFLLK